MRMWMGGGSVRSSVRGIPSLPAAPRCLLIYLLGMEPAHSSQGNAIGSWEATQHLKDARGLVVMTGGIHWVDKCVWLQDAMRSNAQGAFGPVCGQLGV